MDYVCNVSDENETMETPLSAPVWNFMKAGGQDTIGGGTVKKGHFVAVAPSDSSPYQPHVAVKRKRINGQDVDDDGHDDDGQTPGNPGAAYGKPELTGDFTDRDGQDTIDDGGDNGFQEALVAPSMFPQPRQYADDAEDDDLHGGYRRTPADMLAAASDISPDGSEACGDAAAPWPKEVFQKRQRKL